ncbi:MAG: rhomboid family intramembrane serine protease [Acidobacteriaceae bacterium]|nr:rhomboid family intramembrane serine protease [Acidobacteriaceae bacterium]MBV9295346.1 rhomboid family intramembrane serine protease [Acidobacteriaceae bacterium]MBV9764679.1 rhomboid family intramembrane serine protease [Acidobacteriaceae bacterium]
MNSLFPTEERAAQPTLDRDEIPDGLRQNFALLLDWFTPNIYICWTILGINVLVFVAMLLSGFNPDKISPQALLKWGANYGPLTATRNEWWRVLTCLFVHMGFVHVGFNMLVLYQIGPFMERLLGNIGFLIVYLVAGVAGAICSLALNPYVVSAGASGAIFGLYGALIGFLILRRDSIPGPALTKILRSAIIFLIYNAVFGLLRSGVDLAAHGGGLVAGVICGLAISTPIKEGFRQRRLVRVAAAGLGCTVVMTALATQLPRPMDFQAEMKRVGETEQQVLAAYRTILGQSPVNKETEVADRLEAQVIRPWRAEQNSLARFRGLPSRQQHVVDAFLAYMDTRQQGWTDLAQGLRTHNMQLLRQSANLQKQAEDRLKSELGK